MCAANSVLISTTSLVANFCVRRGLFCPLIHNRKKGLVINAQTGTKRLIADFERHRGQLMKFLHLSLVAAMFFGFANSVEAKSAVRDGFTVEQVQGKRILVFRPKVHVGSQSAGGTVTPNADWTTQARNNIDAALSVQMGELGNSLTAAPELYGEDAAKVEEYQALFAAVADSVIEYQFEKGNRLPTKKRDSKEGVFDWSLGEGIQQLPGAKDADYALFIFDSDAYGSTGRKILQIVAILGAGVWVSAGDHRGYAGLVDLKTGNVLWLNADGSMGGDVRNPDGAQKRVKDMLSGFPGAKK